MDHELKAKHLKISQLRKIESVQKLQIEKLMEKVKMLTIIGQKRLKKMSTEETYIEGLRQKLSQRSKQALKFKNLYIHEQKK